MKARHKERAKEAGRGRFVGFFPTNDLAIHAPAGLASTNWARRASNRMTTKDVARLLR